jgi:hypothetical protein
MRESKNKIKIKNINIKWGGGETYKTIKFCGKLSFTLGKNIIKGATQVSGHSLKLHIYITNSSTFGSNVFLTLKIMEFENVVLTKNCSCLCDRGHDCIIYMI